MRSASLSGGEAEEKDSVILETDPAAIAARVSRPRADSGAVDLSNITINEQTLLHAFRSVAFQLNSSESAADW